MDHEAIKVIASFFELLLGLVRQNAGKKKKEGTKALWVDHPFRRPLRAITHPKLCPGFPSVFLFAGD